MVQATDFGDGNDPAEVPPLNWPAVGRILVEREVSARPVVVREVAGEGAAQVPFAKDGTGQNLFLWWQDGRARPNG